MASPAISPPASAVRIPPPFEAMTCPAASPTKTTLSQNVRSTGPPTGIVAPTLEVTLARDALGAKTGFCLMNRYRYCFNVESGNPKGQRIPKPTFALSAPFGIIHEYPPGAICLPKCISAVVGSQSIPSITKFREGQRSLPSFSYLLPIDFDNPFRSCNVE